MNRFPIFRLPVGVLATLLSLVFPAFADETETVRVCGEYLFSPDSQESPKSAFFYAENDARKKAIARVCGERVASWETLTTSSAKGQAYSGVVLTNSVGVIHGVKLLRKGWKFPKAGTAEFYECPSVFFDAEITVKKQTELPDASFTALVEGGKSVYKNGEFAKFRVTPSQNAYLTVLWLNHDFQADVTLSTADAPDNFITANASVPVLEGATFAIESPRAKRETGTLFFVFTKRPYAVLKPKTVKNLEENREWLDRWMASIPLRERFIYALPFTIER